MGAFRDGVTGRNWGRGVEGKIEKERNAHGMKIDISHFTFSKGSRVRGGKGGHRRRGSAGSVRGGRGADPFRGGSDSRICTCSFIRSTAVRDRQGKADCIFSLEEHTKL